MTAAHCIGRTAEGGMALGDYYIEEIVVADGRRLMASPLAVEPVSDLAVLGAVDSQELGEEADAFEDFCSNTKPVRLATGELVHGVPISAYVFTRNKGSSQRAPLSGVSGARCSPLRAMRESISAPPAGRPAGTKFSYSSVETQVLGLVLTRAIGRPTAEYLEQKIWQPLGAEADATWLVDNSGQEAAYCCLNAVLRDYARLGLLLAHDGNWRGRPMIPTAWVLEATTVPMDQPHVWPGTATPNEGYGYQTWILPGERRTFMLWGAHGQRIYVDPRSKLVMVHTAVHKLGLGLPPLQEIGALWAALVRQLGS